MSAQFKIAVAALSVVIRLIGIYTKPFLKHTGDPRTHALLAFARNPYYLIGDLMLLDHSVPATPSDTWLIPSIFDYLFNKKCIILYLQELAVRLTVNGIQALQKRSWSPLVNTSRQLDKMTRKEIAKVIIFDEVILWVVTVLCISSRPYRVEGAME
ncbi:hypothetical protein FANTH_7285 [Fusarium anthophilum]|uniref:Uncharacterized protein n=1 Tax=Fusarium anthophilum TaxID=48485 RepID=A0A8H4ZEW6_9HYPO|nr:hypothetical protein FANTH_7285 [Fusarium anthophilum]